MRADKTEAVKKIEEADAVLLGASNGLSITEGLHLFADNPAFEELFGDFKMKFGLRCILQGMGAGWPSEEEKWAFLSRLVQHYCIDYRETQVMKDLKALLDGKEYFIVTSNGECHFELCGFAPERIYEVEGSWLALQCAVRCHDRLYPWMELAGKMAAAQQEGRVPSSLIPRCPVCGDPMQVHMETDGHFIPEAEGKRRLKEFLDRFHGKRLVILELGIGWRNQLIKAPLMRLAATEPKAFYITVNLGEIFIPDVIREKSCGLDGDLSQVLHELAEEKKRGACLAEQK